MKKKEVLMTSRTVTASIRYYSDFLNASSILSLLNCSPRPSVVPSSPCSSPSIHCIIPCTKNRRHGKTTALSQHEIIHLSSVYVNPHLPHADLDTH